MTNLSDATKAEFIEWLERVARLAYRDWAAGETKTGREVLQATASKWRNGHEVKAANIYNAAQFTFRLSENA